MYARPYSRLRLWRDFAVFILESKNAFPSGGRGSFISPLFSDKCHQILSGIMVGGGWGQGTGTIHPYAHSTLDQVSCAGFQACASKHFEQKCMPAFLLRRVCIGLICAVVEHFLCP